jgi:hypothetical protein
MKSRALSVRAVLATTGLAILSGVVHAQERRAFDERGSVLFGMFITQPDTNARFDSSSGMGTDIDLEDDLGLDTSQSVARLSGYYWLGLKHRLDFSLFEFSRNATGEIDRTIEFGDESFAVDTVVNTTADVRIFKAAYTFVPIVRERGDFGITAGLYTAAIDLGLADVQSDTDESGDLTAPLPVIGVRGRFAISDRIALSGAIELFSIDTGDVGGRLSDGYVGVDYSFGNRIGVCLAYNLVSMNVDAEDADGFLGQLDWGYDGFMLYLKLDFGQ